MSVYCRIVAIHYKKNLNIITIRKLKKGRQCFGQKKKDKQPSTKHTHQTKDRVTRTPIETGENSGASEGCTVPAPPVARVVLVTRVKWIYF